MSFDSKRVLVKEKRQRKKKKKQDALNRGNLVHVRRLFACL